MSEANGRYTDVRRGPGTRVAKVGFKKTRTGCLICRARKVKCDEGSPVCGNCQRLGLDCEYAKPGHKPARQGQAKSSSRSTPNSEPSQPSVSDGSSERSRLRPSEASTGYLDSSERPPPDRMELRLLHAWMSRGLASRVMNMNPEWQQLWLVDVPQLALDHSNLLYALLAFSATRVLIATPADQELAVARLKYWSLALREQQTVLSYNDKGDIQTLTFSAILISLTAFGMIRDRDLDPYVPPVEWFEVSKGAWHLSPMHEDLDECSTPLRRLADMTASVWRDKNLTRDAIAPIFTPLLQHPWPQDSADDLAAYELPLALITSFQRGIATNEPLYYLSCRICVFAQIVPVKFVRFLHEQRPRALVILAHFFAIAARSGALQFFADPQGLIPSREVQAIARAVPDDWRTLVPEIVSENIPAFGRVT